MLDISDLNIEIKRRAQFLSRDVVYGVYLVFKFCDSRKFSSKPMYVNLNYRKGRIDNVGGTIGYRDPLCSKTGLTKESDIFSLGAVLFDILCGKLSSEKLDDEYLYLPFLAKYHYHLGKLDKRERRPTSHEVVIQLKKALEFQEDYEKWEQKLPADYKDLIQMSMCPEIYSAKKKEELYNIFSTGILLQQDKVLLTFDGDRERNEMVSATMFSYIGSCPHGLKSLPESRLFSPPDVKHEEIGKLKEVQQVLKSNFNVGQAQQLPTNFEEIFKICRNYDDLFWLGEVEGKKLLVLSAKAALYKFSNVDIFTSKPPAESRFQEVIEFLPQQ
nr:protein kinase-like domain, phloem protein 2-like protein [Tanacetum cinerariifolium]